MYSALVLFTANCWLHIQAMPVISMQGQGFYSNETYIRYAHKFPAPLNEFTLCLGFKLFYMRSEYTTLVSYANLDNDNAITMSM